MLHTPGPARLTSGAPLLPQFRIGRVGLTPEPGSSTTMRASPNCHCPADVSLLARFAFRVRVKLTVGTSCPTGVGVPPVQVSVRSPANSDSPSDRAISGTPTLAVHTNGGA